MRSWCFPLFHLWELVLIPIDHLDHARKACIRCGKRSERWL